MKISIKYIFCIISIYLITSIGYAAFESAGGDIITQSMGGAGSARVFSGFGINSNPASYSFITNPEFSFSYQRLYNLKELQQNRLSFKFKFFNGGVSLSYYDFGNRLYRENILSIGYGTKWLERIFIGLSVPVYFLNIEGGGNMQTAGLNSGIVYKHTDNFKLAVNAVNINTPEIGDTSERIPLAITTGVSYTPAPGFQINFDIINEDGFDVNRCIGIEYYGLNKLILRAGINEETAGLSGGFEYLHEYLCLRYTYYTHKHLGYTNMLGIALRIAKTD